MNHPILYGLTGWNLLVLGLFVATVAGLAWGRVCSPATLALGPKRDVGFGLHDLAMALGSFAAGVLLAGGLVSAFLALKGVDQIETLSPMDNAMLNALYPWAMWGPGIVYFLVRLARAGHLRLGGVVPRRPGRDAALALAAVPIAYLLASGLGFGVQVVMLVLDLPIPEHGHKVLQTLTETDPPPGLVALIIVSAVVVAPITEEFFFRGFLQTALQSVIGHDKRWMSILPVSVFFAVIHVGAVPWAMVPVLVLLGAVFGWVYERTGSLWCAVAVHAGFNAASIGLTLWTAV